MPFILSGTSKFLNAFKPIHKLVFHFEDKTNYLLSSLKFLNGIDTSLDKTRHVFASSLVFRV